MRGPISPSLRTAWRASSGSVAPIKRGRHEQDREGAQQVEERGREPARAPAGVGSPPNSAT